MVFSVPDNKLPISVITLGAEEYDTWKEEVDEGDIPQFVTDSGEGILLACIKLPPERKNGDGTDTYQCKWGECELDVLPPQSDIHSYLEGVGRHTGGFSLSIYDTLEDFFDGEKAMSFEDDIFWSDGYEVDSEPTGSAASTRFTLTDPDRPVYAILIRGNDALKEWMEKDALRGIVPQFSKEDKFLFLVQLEEDMTDSKGERVIAGIDIAGIYQKSAKGINEPAVLKKLGEPIQGGYYIPLLEGLPELFPSTYLAEKWQPKEQQLGGKIDIDKTLETFVAARRYWELGISLIPINRADSDMSEGDRVALNKTPHKYVPRWQRLQEKKSSESEITLWFAETIELRNMAFVFGQVSGRLFGLKFTNVAAYDQWCSEGSAHGQDRSTWATISTPEGERLVIARCEDKARMFNPSSAMWLSSNHEGESIGEIKGEGDYEVCAPSIHGSGEAYTELVPVTAASIVKVKKLADLGLTTVNPKDKKGRKSAKKQETPPSTDPQQLTMLDRHEDGRATVPTQFECEEVIMKVEDAAVEVTADPTKQPAITLNEESKRVLQATPRTSTGTDVLAVARQMLKRGISTIPIKRFSSAQVPDKAKRENLNKQPHGCLGGWKRFQTNLPTEHELERWYGNQTDLKNIAIVFGEVSGRLIDIDFDNMAAYEQWCSEGPEYGQDRTTWPTFATSKGRHVIAKCDEDADMIRNCDLWLLSNPVGVKIGEIRGEGGYAVAPPSVHGSGAVYTWLTEMTDTNIVTVSSLAELGLTDGKSEGGAAGKSTKNETKARKTSSAATTDAPVQAEPNFGAYAGSRYLQATRSGVVRDLAKVTTGGRNRALNEGVFKLGQYSAAAGWSREEVYREIEDACLKNGLIADDGQAAFDATFASGWNAGRDDPKRPPGRPKGETREPGPLLNKPSKLDTGLTEDEGKARALKIIDNAIEEIEEVASIEDGKYLSHHLKAIYHNMHRLKAGEVIFGDEYTERIKAAAVEVGVCTTELDEIDEDRKCVVGTWSLRPWKKSKWLDQIATKEDFYNVDEHPFDHGGQAAMVYTKHGHHLHYVSEIGPLHYNGQYWERDTEGAEMATYTAEMLREREASLRRTAQNPPRSALSGCRYNTTNVDGTCKVLKRLTSAKIEVFDVKPYELNVGNGVVDLRTSEITEHDHKQKFLYCNPTPYDPDADQTQIREFVRQCVIPEHEEYTELSEIRVQELERAIGYTITGELQEEVFIYLYGKPRAGKSTLITAIENALGNKLCGNTSMSTFTKKGAETQAKQFSIAALKDARLVTINEGGINDYLDSEALKLLTGGDTIEAQHKFKGPFSFKPQFKAWFTSNHPPSSRGDRAFWESRIRLIEFPNDRIGSADPEVKARLIDDTVGNLSYFIELAREYYLARKLSGNKSGLIISKNSEHVLAEAALANDTVAQWLEECATSSTPVLGASTPVSKAFPSYQEWCRKNDIDTPVRIRSFNTTMKDKGFSYSSRTVAEVQTSSGSQKRWMGLELP